MFGYRADAPRAAEISLLMPHRIAQYATRELAPIFQMNLPEGYVLDRLRQRLAKATPIDPMLLLALTGREAAIGRVHVRAPPALSERLAPASQPGERLSQILAWDGAEDLFEELARRYLLRSGISGVQPKLLVPEAPESDGKVSLATAELIVKSGGTDYAMRGDRRPRPDRRPARCDRAGAAHASSAAGRRACRRSRSSGGL